MSVVLFCLELPVTDNSSISVVLLCLELPVLDNSLMSVVLFCLEMPVTDNSSMSAEGEGTGLCASGYRTQRYGSAWQGL